MQKKLKKWAVSNKEPEVESKENHVPAVSSNTLDKPVAVTVPRRPLLDIPVSIERSYPNGCLTFVSTVVTMAVMGLCFVVVGVPPLFLDDWKGKRIYVGIMVPLLTLLCTVLLYYVMQQPQRVFNAALVKLVKDMEHHSNYLNTAVENVEKELIERGVNLSAAANSSFLGGHPRSSLATPEESSMQRNPSGALRSTSSCSLNGGVDFLRGIDKLDESHDITIATVHVGKEWKWFTELLGEVRKSTFGGSNMPGLAYQRIIIRMLTVAIARAEKLILSLYFSSFLLQRLNAVAPLNLWGTSASAVGVSEAYRGGDMHSRALVTVLGRGGTTNNGLPQAQRSPHQVFGGSGESFSENTFTLGNNPAKGGSRTVDPESPVFSTAAVLEVRGDDAASMELTPPSHIRGEMFGKKVKLPHFTPLINSGDRNPSVNKAGQTPQQQRQQLATPSSAAMSEEAELNEEAAVAAAPNGTQRPSSVSASAALPSAPSAAKVGEARTVLSDRPLLSATDDESQGDIDVEAAETPLGKVRSGRQLSLQDAHAHSVVVVQNRSAVGEDKGVCGNGSSDHHNRESVLSPVSTLSTRQPSGHGDSDSASPTNQQHQPPQPQQRQRDVDATPDKQLSSFDTTQAPFPVVSSSPASPPPVRPPLRPLSPSSTQPASPNGDGGRPRRQPGSATVQSPSLVLYRGARFVNDEDAVFFTILVHVRKARVTCFSRLYGALAHLRDDGKECKYYFANAGDSSMMRRSPYSPLTLFHISDVGGEREGLTVQEQRLLSFVYCRPERHSEVADASTQRQATDLSSLAVKDSISSATSPAALEETESSPHREVTSVYAEEVDAFILAMGILRDRAMRLTSLPAHVTPVAGLKADAVLPPPLKTVPVLECVVDDVLCVLTKIEVTVDASFRSPSKILLVGVSLEDLSEGSERGVDDDLESLAEAQELREPAHSSADSSPSARYTRSMATSQRPRGSPPGALTSGTRAATTRYFQACTVGQEFREVITMEGEGSVTAEPSAESAAPPG